jgi:hypothetical protein
MAPIEVLRRAAVTAAIELGAIPKGCSNSKKQANMLIKATRQIKATRVS